MTEWGKRSHKRLSLEMQVERGMMGDRRDEDPASTLPEQEDEMVL